MDTNKWLDVLVVVVLVGLAWFGMTWGWRRARKRQAGFGPLSEPPADRGDVVFAENLFYVATTYADKPLERIVIAPLGYRGRAELAVTTAGVQLELAGSPPFFIPHDSVRGAGRATWTIDRAVGGEGLVFVRWLIPATEGPVAVDTYFRPTDPAALVEALETLTPHPEPAA